jgi:hypothetical protein
VGWFQRARDWLNSLGSGSGGKRPRYRTHTDDGQQILIDSSETIIGNNEATAFFRDLCGGSLKEIMLRQGLTNIPLAPEDEETTPDSAPVSQNPQALALFRKLGLRISSEGGLPVFVKPGTYPHVELAGRSVPDLPEDGRPLVIYTDAHDRRPSHATVVFTVLDPRRRSLQKQVTVHFHGRGLIRAKGFARELGGTGRPIHYDGEEVRALLDREARPWARRIYWCSSLERY